MFKFIKAFFLFNKIRNAIYAYVAGSGRIVLEFSHVIRSEICGKNHPYSLEDSKCPGCIVLRKAADVLGNKELTDIIAGGKSKEKIDKIVQDALGKTDWRGVH